MPIKYQNGTVAKAGDPVVGLDWRGGVVKGIAIQGDTRIGQPELVFQHAEHKTVCPSLDLRNFLRVDEAETSTDGVHSVKPTASAENPAAPTGAA